jgi:hypothetical protein
MGLLVGAEQLVDLVENFPEFAGVPFRLEQGAEFAPALRCFFVWVGHIFLISHCACPVDLCANLGDRSAALRTHHNSEWVC